MAIFSLLRRFMAQSFDTQTRRERRFLAGAVDAGDLERRLALLEGSERCRATGIVGGLYPR